MVFNFALKRQFIPDPSITNTPQDNNIYYTFRKDDLAIDFDGSVQSIVRTIKAFNTPLKGAYFEHNGRVVTVCDVRTLTNAFVSDVFCDNTQRTVLMKFDNRLVTKIDDIYLELTLREGDIDALSVGDSLC
jgi:methionyl-tRNA formyltransferase